MVAQSRWASTKKRRSDLAGASTGGFAVTFRISRGRFATDLYISAFCVAISSLRTRKRDKTRSESVRRSRLDVILRSKP